MSSCPLNHERGPEIDPGAIGQGPLSAVASLSIDNTSCENRRMASSQICGQCSADGIYLSLPEA